MEFIIPFGSNWFGKYAIFINLNIFLKLSYPKPIITAAKVPPNTIIIGGIKNKALTDPPSSTNAPKIENIPKINPLNALYFFIISSQVTTGVRVLIPVFVKPGVNNPGSVNQQLLWPCLLHFLSELIPAN